MLSIKAILNLKDQGFTADQIELINSLGAGNTIPETAGDPPMTPAPAADPGPAEPEPASAADPGPAEPEPAPAADPQIAELTKTVSVLAETVKALQLQNQKSARQDPPEPVTADSIIKDFFSPKERK